MTYLFPRSSVQTKYLSIFVVALLTVIAACDDSSLGSTGVIDQILPPIVEADRIDVRRHGNLESSLQITEPSTIDELRKFVNSYPAGWSVPFTGPPVGQLYFDFYSQDVFVGNFYIGPQFFGRDHGNFFSRSATEDEIAKLNSIVGFAVLE